MTLEDDLTQKSRELRTSLIHDIQSIAEVGINDIGFARMDELIHINNISEALDNSLARRIRKIDDATDHILSSDTLSARAKLELTDERKHSFRVLRKLSPNYDSALVVWYFWLRDNDIDIHSALELCDYFGVEKVLVAYNSGVPLNVIDTVLSNELDVEMTRELLSD